MSGGFADTFGGGMVQPGQVSLNQLDLLEDADLEWPSLATSGDNVVAKIMEVTPDRAGLSVIMPDARGTSVGTDALFRNMGADTYSILDNLGATIGTVAAGVSKYMYLSDASTQGGSWSIFTFGTGTSEADSALLAGYGTVATGATLSQSHDVVETAIELTVLSSHRASTIVYTAGFLPCNLPVTTAVGDDFFFIIRNAGTGDVVLTPAGLDEIDGALTLSLAPGDACMVFSNGVDTWYTVGLGRSVSFAFTQLVKSVAGNVNVTLSAAECANKVISLVGLLTGDISVIVPNTVSVYYLYNNTTGAYSITFKTAAGTGVVVPQTTRDILVCDATNVQKAVTNYVAVTEFATAAAAAPSITFVGRTTEGFYSPTATSTAVASRGLVCTVWANPAVAVNYIEEGGSATGNPVTITAKGTDTNIGINLVAKGSGAVTANGLPFPTGTRMAFQQTAAPTGWTKDVTATYDNSALRIVTGAAATGGAVAFTTALAAGLSSGSYTLTTSDIPSHTHTGTTGTESVGHTHTASGTTTGQSATHTHQAYYGAAGGGTVLGTSNVADTNTGGYATGNASGDHSHDYNLTTAGVSASHTHSFTTGGTGGGGGHAHTLPSFAVKYTDFIIATKN